MSKKQAEEKLFCSYFISNPEDSFNDFINYVSSITGESIEYKTVRAIAERLKRKYILTSEQYNDINGYLRSKKTIIKNWQEILK